MRNYEVMGVLAQVVGIPATGAAGDVNSTLPRPEPALEWVDGELPDQSFGPRHTMMPGVRVFRLPANLAQLWADTAVEDGRETLANGQRNPTFGQKVARKMLKLTKAAPLVVVGGADDGLPLTWNPSSSPRPRGKKDDPKTPWISELAYLYDVGLQGGLPAAQRDRPQSIEGLVAGINKFAGKTVRLGTGLSGQCRDDKVRYISIEIPNPNYRADQPVTSTNQPTDLIIQLDPTGQKGCGSRYYTEAFKATAEEIAANGPPYVTEIACTGDKKHPGGCGAALRGFESVDSILTPLGT